MRVRSPRHLRGRSAGLAGWVWLSLLATLPLLGCAVVVHDQPPGKVLVCHKGKKTLSVSKAALDAHLRHGDYRGRCR